MDVDVAAFGSQHALVAGKDAVYYGSIRLCASDQEMYPCIWSAACFTDEGYGFCRIRIRAIAGSLFVIGFKEAFHHFRMGSSHVVGIKVDHIDVNFHEKTKVMKISMIIFVCLRRM